MSADKVARVPRPRDRDDQTTKSISSEQMGAFTAATTAGALTGGQALGLNYTSAGSPTPTLARSYSLKDVQGL